MLDDAEEKFYSPIRQMLPDVSKYYRFVHAAMGSVAPPDSVNDRG